MDRVKILEVKESVLGCNDKQAEQFRKELGERGILYLNLMSSPGSGKTTTILGTIKLLKDKYGIGVMDADIDSDVDALAAANAGVRAIQLHTGGMCHLDADMSRQGMDEMGTEGLDLVILENVGNLVCPAEFDTGAQLNAVILSVPEGEDKPLKYPLVFKECEAVLINKIDALPVFDFNMELAKKYILERNPNAKIFPVSAKTGEGMEAWCDYLSSRIEEVKGN